MSDDGPYACVQPIAVLVETIRDGLTREMSLGRLTYSLAVVAVVAVVAEVLH